MASYIPQQGDFVIVSFDPQSGHEQKGRRPALVVSKSKFNEKTGLAIVCPITSTQRNSPFHVPILNYPFIKGFVMAEQVKSIDYSTRSIKYLGKAPIDVFENTIALLDAFIY
jgi:mRNA interferase MazF